MSLLYADDLVVISDSAVGLQAQLDELIRFSEKYKMAVNIGKTKVMIFRKSGRKKTTNVTWKVCGSDVEICESYK